MAIGEWVDVRVVRGFNLVNRVIAQRTDHGAFEPAGAGENAAVGQ